MKTSFASSEEASCQVAEPVVLTVRGDGTAELSTTGPAFVDHYNCVSTMDETWYIDGKVNEVDQVVSFESCNGGGFSTSGTVNYNGGVLAGEVSCFYKNGSKAITLIVGK